MEIDNTTAAGDETIVLFPRSYNKRGDERLHSVQGLTLDGREVNVKLRIDESMLGKESTPSIAEFSREDVKAKNPCLATPDNAVDNREGVLLFTGCEVEGENRKGIPTFTARWAYVLASHSDDQDPVFGLGRVVIIADNQAVKAIHTELEDLEKLKPVGWEAIAERKRKALSDPLKLSYFGHLYQDAEEKSFPIENRADLTEFADSIFTSYTRSGVVGGVLIRLKDENGVLIPGFSTEVFPRWIRQNTYQAGSDVMKFFFRAHDQRSTENGAATFVAMPIKRYACGPSFKNYYFLKKPEESLQKIRKHFLINNEPTVSRIALSLSLRQESGESFMLKYYPLSSPISSVATIGEERLTADEGLVTPSSGQTQIVDSGMRPKVGLSTTTSLDFPAWYQPHFIELSHLPNVDVSEPIQQITDVREQYIGPEPGPTAVAAASHEEDTYPAAEPKAEPAHATTHVLESVDQPLVGSGDKGSDSHTILVLHATRDEKLQEPPAFDETTSPTVESSKSLDQQNGHTEVLTEDDSEEDDLSGMFSDISEQEIAEADKAAAEILAAVALEPHVEEEPAVNQDEEPFQIAETQTSFSVAPPVEIKDPPVEATTGYEEPTLSFSEPETEMVSQAEVDAEQPSQPTEELRIIDTSTAGQSDAGSQNGVLLAEYTSTSKPPSSEPNGSPVAPEKKSALAMFLERKGLLK